METTDKMKLHWSPRSPYVRKVMICAHELGLVDRLELVRSVAAMRKPNPEIMKDNPLSKIPTMVLPDGTTLFDSIVICEYLDDLAGGKLFPRQGPARWEALRLHALADGLIDNLILWRNERERKAPEQELLDAFEVKVRACIARLEQEAAAIGAVPFNIGHVTLAVALGYADFRFADFAWRALAPKLASWDGIVSIRPSISSTAAAEG